MRVGIPARTEPVDIIPHITYYSVDRETISVGIIKQ